MGGSVKFCWFSLIFKELIGSGVFGCSGSCMDAADFRGCLFFIAD